MNTNTARTVTPAVPRRRRTLEEPKASATPTIEAFLVDYIRNHVNQLTVAVELRAVIRLYFGPLLPYALADLTPLIVERWFHTIGLHSHAQANKSLKMLRTMYGKAHDWRVFEGDNPARRVKKYPEHRRERFVTPEEMPRLMAALELEHEDAQCFFLLCLLVGCRRGEAMTLKWADLDVERRVWRKSHTKTGQAHTVPIPLVLLDRLAALPHVNAFVFSTKQGHWSRGWSYNRWNVIRQAAGLVDQSGKGEVTIHDLRRTCASWLSIYGENMAVVREVLNHSSLSQTGVYARLNVSPVTRALEENSTRMLGTGPSARPIIAPVAMTPPPLLIPAWVPPRAEEREEWPG